MSLEQENKNNSNFESQHFSTTNQNPSAQGNATPFIFLSQKNNHLHTNLENISAFVGKWRGLGLVSCASMKSPVPYVEEYSIQENLPGKGKSVLTVSQRTWCVPRGKVELPESPSAENLRQAICEILQKDRFEDLKGDDLHFESGFIRTTGKNHFEMILAHPIGISTFEKGELVSTNDPDQKEQEEQKEKKEKKEQTKNQSTNSALQLEWNSTRVSFGESQEEVALLPLPTALWRQWEIPEPCKLEESLSPNFKPAVHTLTFSYRLKLATTSQPSLLSHLHAVLVKISE